MEASEAPGHAGDLRDLHAELARHGLLEPSGFWRWKLLFWLPALVLTYIGLIVLPFGPLWLLLAPLCAVALLTMGFVGHDAGHYALVAAAVGERRLGTARDDVAVRHELRVLALAP